jgi:hypothetical protein
LLAWSTTAPPIESTGLEPSERLRAELRGIQTVPNERPSLDAALASYDRASAHEHIALGEQERKEVTDRFPIDQWPAMPLERYALGHGDIHRDEIDAASKGRTLPSVTLIVAGRQLLADDQQRNDDRGTVARHGLPTSLCSHRVAHVTPLTALLTGKFDHHTRPAMIEAWTTQTLIVHVIRRHKIPFLQSRASGPLIAMTAAIMAIGGPRLLGRKRLSQ